MKGIVLKHTQSNFYLEVDGQEIKDVSSYSLVSNPDKTIKLDVSVVRKLNNLTIKGGKTQKGERNGNKRN